MLLRQSRTRGHRCVAFGPCGELYFQVGDDEDMNFSHPHLPFGSDSLFCYVFHLWERRTLVLGPLPILPQSNDSPNTPSLSPCRFVPLQCSLALLSLLPAHLFILFPCSSPRRTMRVLTFLAALGTAAAFVKPTLPSAGSRTRAGALR